MIKNINVRHLKIGMFVCGLDRQWIDTPFFRSKFFIKNAKQISALQEYCKFVCIDVKKGVDFVEEEQANERIFESDGEKNQCNKDNESGAHNTYKKIYDKSHNILNDVLNDIRLGRSVDNPKIKGIVEDLIINVIKDDHAMIGLTRLKQKGDELARKSVNVCILALAFGKYIGIPKNKIHVLGLGALLHDIGMVKIPNKILLKERALNTDERSIMEKHTEYGVTILAGAGQFPVDALKIVYSHHERMDGSGYPQKLKGKEISLLTRMVTIVSVYEALTRERFYAEALSPAEALTYLYNSVKAVFDASLVEKFIQMIGIYPLGCVVELNTGEIGIVAGVNQQQLRPVLHIVTDACKQLLENKHIVDLSKMEGRNIEVTRTLAKDDPVIELITTFYEQARH